MSKPKFLIDENVKRELLDFLKKEGWDVKTLAKGAKDKTLAQVSKREKRVLVTNDEDFSYYKKSESFSVVLLKIPQSDSENLIVEFEKVLKQVENFGNNLFILRVGNFETVPLEEDK